MYKQNENTRLLFNVEITEDGKYFAVRTQEPMFCLIGNSIQEVCESAEFAFDAYKRLMGNFHG